MDCCPPKSARGSRCPRCDSRGRPVPFATLESLLTARARARLTQADFYYCAAFDCRAVYFSHGELFEVEDLRVPVFHKQTAGKRIVCYCLEIREDDADFETSAVARVRAFVRAGSCTCEATNPEGRCCLANFRDASSAAATVVDPR